jgi:hypothetical protein
VLANQPGNELAAGTAPEAAEQVEELTAPAEALYDAVVRGDENFATALEHAQVRAQQEVAELKNREESLVTQLRRLSQGETDLPREIARGLDRLRGALPQARAKVLCELIEPKAESIWQNAIEGFLGRDRFAVVVEEDTEGRAIDFVRHQLEPVERLKIIQGRRAKREARDPAPASIVEELKVEHPTALAYLRGAYGNVLKVPDVETLRGVSRGVTAEGHGASGFGMFVAYAKDEELVFGIEARQRRQRALDKELRAVRDTLRTLEGEVRNLKSFAARLRKLGLPGEPAAATTIWEMCEVRADALAALGRLDLHAADEVQEELDSLLQLKGTVQAESEKHRNERSRAEVKSEEAGKAREKITAELPVHQAAAANALAAITLLEEASSHRLLAVPLAERAQALAREQNEAALNTRTNIARDNLPTLLGEFVQLVNEYNLHARDVERVPTQRERLRLSDFEVGVRALCVVLGHIERQLKQQGDIGIAQNAERLRQAEDNFHHVFTSDFCFRIRSKVANGVQTLHELNRELEHLVFGGDRFRIEWAWVPQYQDYYRFFDAVHQRADELEQRNLFAEDMLEPDLARIRDELKDLLLSADRDTADKRLKELADYRNYRRYEIYRENPTGGKTALSTWGTGSGGQLETPFYVVRSAVLSSALRFFSKGHAQLRLMLSDEAFAKMDESRRRSVIKYLREHLHVQLIVAMPTANAASIKPEFEKEFTFARIPATLADGRDWRVFEAHEKLLKQPALAARWEVAERAARERARTDFVQRNPELDLGLPAVADAPSTVE